MERRKSNCHGLQMIYFLHFKAPNIPQKLLELINLAKLHDTKLEDKNKYHYTSISNYLNKKSRRQSHFKLLHKVKYPGINLTEEVKVLCNENYETKFNRTQNGKPARVHALEDLTILKCTYYAKLSTDLMQFL